MYRHLIVPIDGTAVSWSNVSSAVDLARRLEARITFFHATRDFSATGDGALLRSVDPTLFAESAVGDTNVLLTKAMAAASAAGVPCDSEASTSDRPAEAILEAAERLKCDLIVMASRGTAGGWAGWLNSSQTERVLRHAPIALLVTRVAAAHPLDAADRAIGVIQDEHRSIAVVAQAMRELAQEALDPAGKPDLDALQRMVNYLVQFPARIHHPKEEEVLHRLLLRRSPGSAALVAEVEAQHGTERRLIEEASRALVSARTGGADAVREMAGRVQALCSHVLDHVGLEERSVLPLARASLQDDEWEEVASAFSDNNDPRFGELATAELRRLFAGIANVVMSGHEAPLH
jgi:nucleotide-binding universal stress UspA family protein/hemerythrin-like domain-containing protein